MLFIYFFCPYLSGSYHLELDSTHLSVVCHDERNGKTGAITCLCRAFEFEIEI